MATAGGADRSVRAGVEVVDIGTTAKTLPDFPQMWADMLGTVADADISDTGATAGEPGPLDAPVRRIRRPDPPG